MAWYDRGNSGGLDPWYGNPGINSNNQGCYGCSSACGGACAGAPCAVECLGNKTVIGSAGCGVNNCGGGCHAKCADRCSGACGDASCRTGCLGGCIAYSSCNGSNCAGCGSVCTNVATGTNIPGQSCTDCSSECALNCGSECRGVSAASCSACGTSCKGTSAAVNPDTKCSDAIKDDK